MSLSNNFNIEVSKITTKIGEVELFRSLLTALNKKKNALVFEKHGTKKNNQVVFDNPISKISKVGCEIADLLIIVTSEDEMRYTYLQAKKRAKMQSQKELTPLQNVPFRKHYVLSDFPEFSFKKTPSRNEMFFKNRILDSIGSFGVFRNVGTKYDMDYSIASLLEKKKIPTAFEYDNNKKTTVIYKGSKNKLRYENGFYEVETIANLDDFEKALELFFIGEPCRAGNIDGDRHIYEILKSINKEYTLISDGSNKTINLENVINRYDIKNIHDRVETRKEKATAIAVIDVESDTNESLKNSDYQWHSIVEYFINRGEQEKDLFFSQDGKEIIKLKSYKDINVNYKTFKGEKEIFILGIYKNDDGEYLLKYVEIENIFNLRIDIIKSLEGFNEFLMGQI